MRSSNESTKNLNEKEEGIRDVNKDFYEIILILIASFKNLLSLLLFFH